MTTSAIQTPTSTPADRPSANIAIRVLRAWVSGYVGQYEGYSRGSASIDASARLRWMPVA